MRARWAALFAAVACACSGPAATVRPATMAPASPPALPTPALAAATPTPAPTPPPPPYYVEALRSRPHEAGKIEIGDQVFRGDGFTKSYMKWPSGGQTMTGTISMPDGPGPFPVLVVNHGFIPPDRYWIGQDSGIFGDPLAAHGFISVAPNWPGYAGSGPGAAGVPSLVAEMIATEDLISSLGSLPQADPARVAIAGHSNGGGISLLAMVVDPRVRAVVLFAPVSSDMADNARKWWLNNGSQGGAGTPDANPEGYRHMSPRNYFAAGQPPALFLQGTADEDIPAAWTNASLDAIRAAGIRTDVTWFPGAHHDMVGSDLARAVQLEEQWIRSALAM